jgi:hypothetical protein
VEVVQESVAAWFFFPLFGLFGLHAPLPPWQVAQSAGFEVVWLGLGSWWHAVHAGCFQPGWPEVRSGAA